VTKGRPEGPTVNSHARKPWIQKGMRKDLYAYIGGILGKKRAKLITAGGVADHIHLYASLPSVLSIGEFVNVVKSNSSKWVHESFPRLRRFAWQEGYGAFSVSKSEEHKVIRYILNQETHHAKRTFKQELVVLLDKHGIEYDERYLWV